MPTTVELRQAIGPYALRLSMLYVLLMADISINSVVDAQTGPSSVTWASIELVAQVLVRVCCIITSVGMLSSSRVWRDDFIIDFCGVFAVSLVGIIVALFLRVYRVVLAAFPSRFPTVLDYWSSTEYCLLLLIHIIFSLLFYYMSIMAAHRCGRLKYFYLSTPEIASSNMEFGRVSAPSISAAIHSAAMRDSMRRWQ